MAPHHQLCPLAESDLFSQPGRALEALTPATIFRFPLTQLRHVLFEEPLLQLHLLTKATHELRNAQRQIIILGRLKSTTRLAAFIIDASLHATLFDARTQRLHLPMSRFDIADYLGVTPESVGRAFAILERRGLVRRVSPRLIQILDAGGLARLVRGVPAS